MKAILKSVLGLITGLIFLFGSDVCGEQITVGKNGSYDYNTITQALENSFFGDVILVADGNYTSLNGEIFPLELVSGVVLKSMDAGYRPRIDAGKSERVVVGDLLSLAGGTRIEGFYITGGEAKYQYDDIGAGIYLTDSNLTISRCIITGNHAAKGGAVGAQRSRIRIEHCTITGNISDERGGGIYIEDSKIEIINSVIWGNTDDASFERSEMVISHCNIGNGASGDLNSVFGAPPRFNDPASGDFSLGFYSPCIDRGLVMGTHYQGNAPDIGAYESIYFGPVELPEPVRFTIGDGGDFPSITLALRECNLPGSRLDILPGRYGIDSDEEFPIILYGVSLNGMPGISSDQNVTIVGNVSYSTIYSAYDGNYSLINLNITGGGMSGVRVLHGSPTISGCGFFDNYGYQGGGLYAYDSNLSLDNCVFSGNRGVLGGGAFLGRRTGGSISDCQFVSNQSEQSGGAIAMEGCSTTFIDCLFKDNSSQRDGGGISCDFHSNPRLYKCIIRGNIAPANGGGMQLISSPAELFNTLFFDNRADKGAGIFAYAANPRIINCTFAMNEASETGGALCGMLNAMPTITNTIMYPNKPVEMAFYSGNAQVSYSDIRLGWEGEGNIDADPCFVDSNGDFRLRAYSPCIDTATSEASPQDDLDGNQRPNPQHGGFDMGAYEYYSEYLPIHIAGYMNTNISSAEGGIFTMFAYLKDYSRNGIDSVDIYILGSPSGILLTPDPSTPGVYIFPAVVLPKGVEPARFTLELMPIKIGGSKGIPWPYLWVQE